MTTAHDVAIMSAELIKHEQIFDYTLIWMDYVRGGETQLVNTNRLIRTYKGITGLKTGTTSQAGSCISATAERDNLSLVAVVLGCSTTQERFSSATTLLDYGFANWAAVVPEMPELPAVPVTGGMQSQAEGETGTPGSLLIPKGKESALKSRVEMASSLQAPVEQGRRSARLSSSLRGRRRSWRSIPLRRNTGWKKSRLPRRCGCFCKVYSNYNGTANYFYDFCPMPCKWVGNIVQWEHKQNKKVEVC